MWKPLSDLAASTSLMSSLTYLPPCLLDFRHPGLRHLGLAISFFCHFALMYIMVCFLISFRPWLAHFPGTLYLKQHPALPPAPPQHCSLPCFIFPCSPNKPEACKLSWMDTSWKQGFCFFHCWATGAKYLLNVRKICHCRKCPGRRTY